MQYDHTDGLGSPVARTDAGQALISRTRYEPYGYTAAGATPGIGFTGRVYDVDTGLVYMQQRYYDPVAGRFLSVDPVTTDADTGGSFNRYVYANNNPYSYFDPDGRDPRAIAAAARSHLGETGWGNPGWQGRLRLVFEFKCNAYVNQVVTEVGDTPPLVLGRPAVAGELADKSLIIPNWQVVTDGSVENGDIVAVAHAGGSGGATYTGHTGVIVNAGGANPTSSADSGQGKITQSPFGFRQGENSTIRRYIPGQGNKNDPATKRKPPPPPPKEIRPGRE